MNVKSMLEVIAALGLMALAAFCAGCFDDGKENMDASLMVVVSNDTSDPIVVNVTMINHVKNETMVRTLNIPAGGIDDIDKANGEPSWAGSYGNYTITVSVVGTNLTATKELYFMSGPSLRSVHATVYGDRVEIVY